MLFGRGGESRADGGLWLAGDLADRGARTGGHGCYGQGALGRARRTRGVDAVTYGDGGGTCGVAGWQHSGRRAGSERGTGRRNWNVTMSWIGRIWMTQSNSSEGRPDAR
jgi:hypothetical protein